MKELNSKSDLELNALIVGAKTGDSVHTRLFMYWTFWSEKSPHLNWQSVYSCEWQKNWERAQMSVPFPFGFGGDKEPQLPALSMAVDQVDSLALHIEFSDGELGPIDHYQFFENTNTIHFKNKKSGRSLLFLDSKEKFLICQESETPGDILYYNKKTTNIKNLNWRDVKLQVVARD